MCDTGACGEEETFEAVHSAAGAPGCIGVEAFAEREVGDPFAVIEEEDDVGSAFDEFAGVDFFACEHVGYHGFTGVWILDLPECLHDLDAFGFVIFRFNDSAIDFGIVHGATFDVEIDAAFGVACHVRLGFGPVDGFVEDVIECTVV